MRSVIAALLIISLQCIAASELLGQDRATKVRQDRERFQHDERWIYNRLDWALDEARDSGKPLLVVFRCIPCEACSQFDQKVIEEQSGISTLLDQFVCVRIVQANGLDLNRFQFDYDQSFHAILMNADQVIYGRYGTRSARPEEEDMSVEGFGAALKKAIEWHADYPRNRELFAAKQKSEGFYEVPEEFPSLKGKYSSKLDYEGNVVQSCVHCHQIRDAQRLVFRSKKEPIPDRILFPYPLPDVLGLRMDARACATITEVQTNSIAAKAGLAAGDEVLTIAGQPILSIADVQWVLHNADDATQLEAVVRRGDQQQRVMIPLDAGWRLLSDISFRPTTWDLRRMGTGGLVLKDATDNQRAALSLGDSELALVVSYVGEYGEHATAKNAGFRKGDVIVSVNGQSERMSESRFLHDVLLQPPGTPMQFDVLRDGKKMKLTFATR